VLVRMSKHQGSPGTCRFGSCSHIRACGPGVGSSKSLILNTSSCQGRPRLEGCQGNAGGPSHSQLHWNRLPAARRSAIQGSAQRKSKARAPAPGCSRRRLARQEGSHTHAAGAGVRSGSWRCRCRCCFQRVLCLLPARPRHPDPSAAGGNTAVSTSLSVLGVESTRDQPAALLGSAKFKVFPILPGCSRVLWCMVKALGGVRPQSWC